MSPRLESLVRYLAPFSNRERFSSLNLARLFFKISNYFPFLDLLEERRIPAKWNSLSIFSSNWTLIFEPKICLKPFSFSSPLLPSFLLSLFFSSHRESSLFETKRESSLFETKREREERKEREEREEEENHCKIGEREGTLPKG